MTEPRSPLSAGSEGAVKSSPFAPPFAPPPFPPEAGGSPSEGTPETPLSRRRPSLSSLKLGNNGPPPIPEEPIPRPSTSHSNRQPRHRADSSITNFSRPDPQPVLSKKAAPPRPERPTDEVLSPSFLDKLSAEPVVEMPSTFSPSQPPVPLRSMDRSKTFPLPQDDSDEPAPSQALHKTLTEPQMRGRRPTLTSSHSDTQIPRTRERSQSRSGPRIDARLQDAPPVPKPVLQHGQEGRHSPCGSGSSTASSAPSLANDSSTGPSPVGSAASSMDAFSPLSYDTHQYGNDEGMRVAGLNVKAQQQKPGMRAEQPTQRSPPRNLAGPSSPKQQMEPAPVMPTPPHLSAGPTPLGTPLESPMDPAMMNVRAPELETRPPLMRTHTTPEIGQIPMAGQQKPPVPPLTMPKSVNGYDPYRPDSPQVATRPRTKSNASTASAPQYKAYSPSGSAPPTSPPQNMPTPPPPPIPQEPPRTQTPLSRRGTGARPTCRGCNKIIEGKSVKAADGRLTGRWHKACFTCRTCNEPFTTADFYVIDNHPYCEQHYHEKNGSLCHGCNRGIEGQYLETTTSAAGGHDKKFHPRCFTCHDCRQVLSDDYFEIAGKVYCERHALAAMRGQARMAGGPGGLNPPDRKALTAERRTTKLMMM
jgi:hypothetical protein